ncbi:MAG TPA: hypothetical protein VM489_15580 [Burkholderiales bacterium]|nr:hypothetical protein [Burkholderiales bacterium]
MQPSKLVLCAAAAWLAAGCAAPVDRTAAPAQPGVGVVESATPPVPAAAYPRAMALLDQAGKTTLRGYEAVVRMPDGTRQTVQARDVKPGDRVLVSAEGIAVRY